MSSTTKAETVNNAGSATAAGSTTAVGSSRRMHYPYTFTAKFVQFPYRFHWEQGPFYKYILIGVICSMPLFWKIQKLARSPENIKKWDEIHEHQRNHPKPWDI